MFPKTLNQAKRVGIGLATAIASAASMGVALAQTEPTDIVRDGGLHFVGTPTVTATCSPTEAFLTAVGEVAGAGTSATATLSSEVIVTRGCINRGAREHQPRGLQRTMELTAGVQTFETRQGRGTFSVSTDPVSVGSFRCPDQMIAVLVSAEFTEVTLTVTSQTGTTTAFFPDVSCP